MKLLERILHYGGLVAVGVIAAMAWLQFAYLQTNGALIGGVGFTIAFAGYLLQHLTQD